MVSSFLTILHAKCCGEASEEFRDGVLRSLRGLQIQAALKGETRLVPQAYAGSIYLMGLTHYLNKPPPWPLLLGFAPLPWFWWYFR